MVNLDILFCAVVISLLQCVRVALTGDEAIFHVKDICSHVLTSSRLIN